MMSRTSLQQLALVSAIASLISAAPIISCSSQTTVGENVGTTSAPLTVGKNYNVTPNIYQMHETSVVSALYDSPAGGLIPHWVVGFNNCVPDALQGCSPATIHAIAGWSTSPDQNGNAWTAHTQATGLFFGTPGELGARAAPNGGGTFLGWGGDPSLAIVTDPALSNGGRRVMYTNVGDGTIRPGSDVVVALSDDGGETWGHAQFANDPASGGYLYGGQWYGVDQPKLASNPSAPYGTYVSWTADPRAYINKISYANSPPPTNYTFSLGMPVGGLAVPIPPLHVGVPPNDYDLPIFHPKIVPFTHTSCIDGTPHEAVYVVWSDNAESRCQEPLGGTRDTMATGWEHAIYDTLDGWSGPWMLDADNAWPHCVGLPINGAVSSNNANPAVAFDSSTNTFWVAHTQGTAYGSRVFVMPQQTFVCQSGALVPAGGGAGVGWKPGNFCYNTAGCVPGGPNGADGGYVMNDEWGPAMAFVLDGTTVPATPRLAVSWYDTTYDQGNNIVRIWGTESRDYGNTFDIPVTVSKFSTGQAPWDHTLADWWDYQSIGVDQANGRFLDVWGGDARFGTATTSSIWSAILR